MAILQINVARFSLVSSKPFESVIETIDAQIGHPNMAGFWNEMSPANNYAQIEKVIQRAVGPSGFMLFARLDHGQFLKKAQVPNALRIFRLIVGNPLIMLEMAKHIPDAGSYAPVTILIDERADGVHLSYDLMASYLAQYGNLAALKVARSLDVRVEALLQAAAS